MEKDPLISVITPTYNEERYIKDLLESIKQQTYQNYEIIIIDYNSTDNTVEICKSYGARIFTTDKPGVAAAKNVGIKNAKGDIIAFIDADYILSKKLFEDVVKTFLNDDTIVAVEPRSRVNIKDLNVEKRVLFKFYSRWQNMYKYISFFTHVPAAYGCVFCRADGVKKAGFFNENITINEDKEFFARIRQYGKFKMIKSTVRKSFRRHLMQGIIRTELIYFFSMIPAFLTKNVKIPLKPFRGKKN